MAPHPVGLCQMGGAVLQIKGRSASLPRNDTQGGILAGKVFLPCFFSVSQLFLSLPGIPALSPTWAQETVVIPRSGIGTLVHRGVEAMPAACAIPLAAHPRGAGLPGEAGDSAGISMKSSSWTPPSVWLRQLGRDG